jgi:hypothetical protein
VPSVVVSRASVRAIRPLATNGTVDVLKSAPARGHTRPSSEKSADLQTLDGPLAHQGTDVNNFK